MSDELNLQDEAVQAAIAAAAEEKAAELAAVKIAEETEGLRNKNQQLLGEVKKFKGIAAKIPEDFDPEAWQELKTREEQAREEAAKQAGKWDEYKAELVETHKAETAALRDREAKLQQQLENVLVNNAIMTAISHAKGNPDLLMPHVRGHVRLFDEEGEQVARVVDKAGNPRIAGANGDFMTIEALLDEFKESQTFAPCFEGSRASGSGAAGGNGSGGAEANPFAKETLNLTEQARLNREDPAKAARLKAAAGA